MATKTSSPMWAWIVGGCAAGAAVVLGGAYALGLFSNGEDTTAPVPSSSASAADAEVSASPEGSASAEAGAAEEGGEASSAPSATSTPSAPSVPAQTQPDESNFLEVAFYPGWDAVDDHRIVVNDDGLVYLYDFATKERVWEYAASEPGDVQASVEAGIVLISQLQSIETFDLESGERLASMGKSPEQSSPVLCGEHAVAVHGPSQYVVSTRTLDDVKPIPFEQMLGDTALAPECWDIPGGVAVGWNRPHAQVVVVDGQAKAEPGIYVAGRRFPTDANGIIGWGEHQGKQLFTATQDGDHILLAMGPGGVNDTLELAAMDVEGREIWSGGTAYGGLQATQGGTAMFWGDPNRRTDVSEGFIGRAVDIATGDTQEFPLGTDGSISTSLDRWGNPCTLEGLFYVDYGALREGSGPVHCFTDGPMDPDPWTLQVESMLEISDGYWLVSDGMEKARIFR